MNARKKDSKTNLTEQELNATDEASLDINGNEEAATEGCEEPLSPEETLQIELDALKDKHLRLMAEYDNYRKRTMQEMADLLRNGGERVLLDLLPVVDDFELAVKNSEQSDDLDAIREGVLLIYSKFNEYLGKQGVKKIETTDAPFDDNLHEAIALIPAPQEELKGKVVDCIKSGYKLNDKVIRYARVVVGE